MIIFYAITALTLLAQTESFKISLKPPSGYNEASRYNQQPAELYPVGQQPIYQQQTREVELGGLKGGHSLQQDRLVPLTRPLLAQGPLPQAHSLAYVIIRPIIQAPQYQYLEPMRLLPPPRLSLAPPQPAVGKQAVKGGDSVRFEQSELQQQPLQQQPLQQQPIKGAPELHEPALPINQQAVYEEQQVESQGAHILGPIVVKGQGKLSKLMSHFDKLAASARSKLTLGSYHVQSEEFIPPLPLAPVAPPLQAPLEQQQQQQHEDIGLTAQEQESIHEAEKQEQLKTDETKSLAPQREQQQQQVRQEKGLAKQQLDDSFGELKREQVRPEQKN